MSLLNEKGRMSKNTRITGFILYMMPLIIGVVFNMEFMLQNPNTTEVYIAFYPYLLFWMWGILFWGFDTQVRKKRAEWRKRELEI